MNAQRLADLSHIFSDTRFRTAARCITKLRCAYFIYAHPPRCVYPLPPFASP